MEIFPIAVCPDKDLGDRGREGSLEIDRGDGAKEIDADAANETAKDAPSRPPLLIFHFAKARSRSGSRWTASDRGHGGADTYRVAGIGG